MGRSLINSKNKTKIIRFRLVLLLMLSFSTFFSCSKKCDVESVDIELILNESEIQLNIGEEAMLSVTNIDIAESELFWESDNEDVATVVEGVVKALKSGVAEINVSYKDVSTSCVVDVKEKEYKLVWSDEFDGTELDIDNWSYDIGNGIWGWGVGEQGFSTSRTENVRVENGLLTIEARREEMGGFPYTTGRIKTRDKRDFTYGKIEARFKVPSGVGTWPAIWMLGYGQWPQTGEIDIMEHVGFEPKSIYAAFHSLNKNGINGQNFLAEHKFTQNASAEFHTVTLDWVEKEELGFDSIHVYMDGIEMGVYRETEDLRQSGDWPFSNGNKFHFVVNLSIGGNWGGIHGIDDTIFDNPVLYQIDYVRVYQLE